MLDPLFMTDGGNAMDKTLSNPKTSLQHLDVTGNNLTDEGLKAISR